MKTSLEPKYFVPIKDFSDWWKDFENRKTRESWNSYGDALILCAHNLTVLSPVAVGLAYLTK